MRAVFNSKDIAGMELTYATMQYAMALLPKKTTEKQPITRRTMMQATGAAPKPKGIEQPYKRRAKLNAEKRTKRRCLAEDEEVRAGAEKILRTGHAYLQTYFICGKRAPPNDDMDQIEWVSCSNNETCSAWAHISYCSGIEWECCVRTKGVWQFELLDDE
ncbi:unnamed protein product [Heligmosomoides polygyrus]|uniref:Thyroglobulin type-1 domain-containing protein n=1 Tax=Heligmosomoides polygyrus TaxID=6339 RepID=A0A183G7R9_HELPZ|nr:unnamed protein product [Heligmosomoides polygyrus]